MGSLDPGMGDSVTPIEEPPGKDSRGLPQEEPLAPLRLKPGAPAPVTKMDRGGWPLPRSIPKIRQSVMPVTS